MESGSIEQQLLAEYAQGVRQYLVERCEIPGKLADRLLNVHASLIEDSYRQDFPEDFCIRRIQMANWKNSRLGRPHVMPQTSPPED